MPAFFKPANANNRLFDAFANQDNDDFEKKSNEADNTIGSILTTTEKLVAAYNPDFNSATSKQSLFSNIPILQKAKASISENLQAYLNDNRLVK